MTHAISELTILIPVFGAVEETLDCLRSLLASDARSARILVMDDGSKQDDSKRLADFASDHQSIDYVGHFKNRGYTRNIAYGLSLVETPFVCILNSDTLVPGVWAGGLLRCFQDAPALAGVGPLSNAATYQSVPDLKDDTGQFSVNDGLGEDEDTRNALNLALLHLGQHTLIDAPVLNGFCTVFRVSALRQIGGFDIAGFPRGYGEENDLCIRLTAEGYRLAIWPGCFIHHRKSASFGHDKRRELSKLGSQTLRRKYSASLLREISQELETLWEMEAVRRAVRAMLPALTWMEPDEITGPARLTLGPGDVFIEHGIDALVPELCAEANGDISITLPAETTLPYFKGAPVESTLAALALMSARRDVRMTGWQGQSEAEEQGGMPFGLLYCRMEGADLSDSAV